MNRGSLYVSVIDDLFYLILFFHSSILILGPYTFNWILHSLNTNNSIHIRLDTYSEICIYIISFLKYLFIYFWLHWVFVAALGLSLLRRADATLCCGARASHCGGFSCCGAQALGAQASVVVDRGLYSAGSVVVAHGLCGSAACGIFPDQGSNPCPLHW